MSLLGQYLSSLMSPKGTPPKPSLETHHSLNSASASSVPITPAPPYKTETLKGLDEIKQKMETIISKQLNADSLNDQDYEEWTTQDSAINEYEWELVLYKAFSFYKQQLEQSPSPLPDTVILETAWESLVQLTDSLLETTETMDLSLIMLKIIRNSIAYQNIIKMDESIGKLRDAVDNMELAHLHKMPTTQLLKILLPLRNPEELYSMDNKEQDYLKAFVQAFLYAIDHLDPVSEEKLRTIYNLVSNTLHVDFFPPRGDLFEKHASTDRSSDPASQLEKKLMTAHSENEKIDAIVEFQRNSDPMKDIGLKEFRDQYLSMLQEHLKDAQKNETLSTLEDHLKQAKTIMEKRNVIDEFSQITDPIATFERNVRLTKKEDEKISLIVDFVRSFVNIKQDSEIKNQLTNSITLEIRNQLTSAVILNTLLVRESLMPTVDCDLTLLFGHSLEDACIAVKDGQKRFRSLKK